MNAGRATALVVALGAGAIGCAKAEDQATSVYLEVANGAGAPPPGQVTIDIYARGDAGQPGALLKTIPALAAQPGGELLGTLVIYPGAGLTGMNIRAQGMTGGRVTSQGSVDVDVVPGRQVKARITLASAPADDAGIDGGAPDAPGGDGGAPDGNGDGGDGGGGPDGDGGASVDAGRDGAGDQGGSPGDARDVGPRLDGGGSPIIISVDFVGAAAVAMGATEQAGVVPATHWSSATSGIGALANLADSNGGTTTTSIGWNAGAATNTYLIGIADVAGDSRMMNGYLDPTNGQVAMITVATLPGALASAGYDVYVYTNGSVPAGETRTFGYAIGTATFTLTETMAQIFSGTYVLAAPAPTVGAGNYVVFRGLRGSGFTLTATPGASTSAFRRAPVNGLQIVGN